MNQPDAIGSNGPPTTRPLLYQPEIQQMMYVFGEVPEAIDEVTILVEQIVQRHTMEMIVNSHSIAKLRGAKTITVDDIVFLVRHDKSRVNRLKDYLGWKDVRKSAKSEDKDDLDVGDDDAADATGASKKRVKFTWEYFKEFTDHLEDEINEDDEENLEAYRDTMLRLKADDEATLKMTQAEYMFYSECKTASFTHRKNKRFRDWALTDTLGGGRSTDDVIDVVGFLCYEMVRQLTETALQVRKQTDCQRALCVANQVSSAGDIHPAYPSPRIVPLHNTKPDIHDHTYMTTSGISGPIINLNLNHRAEHLGLSGPATDPLITGVFSNNNINKPKTKKSVSAALAKAKAAEKLAEEKLLASKAAEAAASTSQRKGRKLAKTKASKALVEAKRASKEAIKLREMAAAEQAAFEKIASLGTDLYVETSGLSNNAPLPPASFSESATPLRRLTGIGAHYNPLSSFGDSAGVQLPPTYASPQWRITRVTPLSAIELSLAVTSQTPLHSIFTLQWSNSLPSMPPTFSSPTSAPPQEIGATDGQTEDQDIGKTPSRRTSCVVVNGSAPTPRKDPLTAKHIEEAYRRLMTARCHTRVGGRNIKARPRRL